MEITSLHILALEQGCYTGENCDGTYTPKSTARQCCVDTDDGMSYADGSGTCVVPQCKGISISCIIVCLPELAII